MSAEELNARLDTFATEHGIEELDTPETAELEPVAELFENLVPEIYDKYTGLGDAPAKKPRMYIKLRGEGEGRKDMYVSVEGGSNPTRVEIFQGVYGEEDESTSIAKMINDEGEPVSFYFNLKLGVRKSVDIARAAVNDAHEEGLL